MQKRNLHRLQVGMKVTCARYMVGQGSRGSRSSLPYGGYECGIVVHVTEKGGVKVRPILRDTPDRVADSFEWWPYHAVRVTDTDDGEPRPLPRVKRRARQDAGSYELGPDPFPTSH